MLFGNRGTKVTEVTACKLAIVLPIISSRFKLLISSALSVELSKA